MRPRTPGSSQSVLDAVNEKRASVNCPKVKGDEKLRVAAERYAVDLRDHPEVRGKSWPHPGSDGSNAPSRIAAAGFAPAAAIGEVAYLRKTLRRLDPTAGPMGHLWASALEWRAVRGIGAGENGCSQ
ncbi:CAP domain-containing protein [Streptomyces bicolor]|uniref:CAP domain-containing protein n=1 Tax=Streptomyces bicolor TaxID=66874 RepID=UPI0034DD6739